MLELSSIKLKSGMTIHVPSGGALCVVGGNNVGKSTLLREIVGLALAHPDPNQVLLEGAELKFTIPPDEVVRWITANFRPNRQSGRYSPPIGGREIGEQELAQLAQSGQTHLLSGWAIQSLSSSERQYLISQRYDGIGTFDVDNNNPLFRIYRDGDLEVNLSKHCEAEFGFPLTLDRASGTLQIRVGKPDVPSPPLQHPTREYVESVERLAPLEQQGDGVKNYLGTVAHFMLSPAPITIIDEPEGFLHPPQARALGRFVGRQLIEGQRQLITATHDRDFVLGLLNSGANVTFVRLNRHGDVSNAAVLPSDQVKEIWDRPELRYSNLLQGLFHRAVVVCESDADCRWYSAVADELALRENFPSEEILFLPAGGKSGVKNCISALRAIKVPCFAILDFDVLLDPDQLKILIQEVGYPNVDNLVTKCRNMVRDLDANARRQVKENGVSGLPRGTKQTTAQELLQELNMVNILVVPIGELESFDGALGGKSSTWVTRALEKGVHRTSTVAFELLQPVVQSLGGN